MVSPVHFSRLHLNSTTWPVELSLTGIRIAISEQLFLITCHVWVLLKCKALPVDWLSLLWIHPSCWALNLCPLFIHLYSKFYYRKVLRGPDIPGATQNTLAPPNCLLMLLTHRLLSQRQANSSQIWLYVPGLLHWLGPTSCPLLTLFAHIRLHQVRYRMRTVCESLYLTSSKACLAWSEMWLSDDQSGFLNNWMPAHETSFNFFFLVISIPQLRK